MATDGIQAEAPASKRVRLETSEDLADPTIDAMDDIYSSATNTPATEASPHPKLKTPEPVAIVTTASIPKGIPGLGLLGPEPLLEQKHIAEGNLDPSSGSDFTNMQRNVLGHSMATPASSSAHVSQDHVVLAGSTEDPKPKNQTETEDLDSPSVTTALETLLGGLLPQHTATDAAINDATQIKDDVQPNPGGEIADLRLVDSLLRDDHVVSGDTDRNPTLPGGLPSDQDGGHTLQQNMILDNHVDNINPAEAEFEIDSSPIESSSDDSDSDSSSSSEDSEGEDSYKLLDPEEQARILMEGDGGSDDEGGKGAKGSGAQLRTKNEVPEEVIPKPDVTITPEMKIEELGVVEAVVESILLITAKISGEHRVLESGSVLCLEDRTVIGVVSETLGRVQQPLYSVRFTNPDEIAAVGLERGTKIYYPERYSTYVFTQALKVYKGSDASNLHDEEVGDEEIEFSDDEAEAEHKRRVKQKRQERRGGRAQQNGAPNKAGHPPQQQQKAYDPSMGLSYDDDDEGPYKPLARPPGFADSVGRSEAPQESVGYAGRALRDGRDSNPPQPSRDPNGRGRGGRGDRGRGRGERGRGNDRGRGRSGFPERRSDGYSQAPQEHRHRGHIPPSQTSPIPANYPTNNYEHGQAGPEQYYHAPPPQVPVPYAHPPFPRQPFQYPHPAPPSFPLTQTSWGHAGPAPAMPSGAFINPAFFGNQAPGAAQPWSPSAPPPRHADGERAFQEAQERLNILRNLEGSR